MDALQAGIYPMDFVQRYFASFYCVACTLMGNRQTINLQRHVWRFSFYATICFQILPRLINGPSYYPDNPRKKRSLA